MISTFIIIYYVEKIPNLFTEIIRVSTFLVANSTSDEVTSAKDIVLIISTETKFYEPSINFVKQFLHFKLLDV